MSAREETNLRRYLETCESQMIRETLKIHRWKIRETAESLGISRKNLWEKMKRHGIQEETNES